MSFGHTKSIFIGYPCLKCKQLLVVTKEKKRKERPTLGTIFNFTPTRMWNPRWSIVEWSEALRRHPNSITQKRKRPLCLPIFTSLFISFFSHFIFSWWKYRVWSWWLVHTLSIFFDNRCVSRWFLSSLQEEQPLAQSPQPPFVSLFMYFSPIKFRLLSVRIYSLELIVSSRPPYLYISDDRWYNSSF